MQSAIEPDEVVAIGCTMQATLILSDYPLDSDKSQNDFASTLTPECSEVACLSKPIGLLLPTNDVASPHAVDGKQFVSLLDAFTPLPIKRSFQIALSKIGQSGQIPIDLWQGLPSIKVEELNSNGRDRAADDEEDDEEEEEAERTRITIPDRAIAHLDVPQAQIGGKLTIVLTIEGGRGKVEVSSGLKGTENAVQVEFSLGA